MDRQIVYNGQLPLETDVLNTNLYAMIGLGRLAMDVLGTSTVVSGLACTPTSVPSLSVNIGAGAIYSLENIDDTAYSSLPANTADQIMKQGILTKSDALQLTMTAPTTPGQSIIYIVEAAYEDLDTGNAVLNYYDAANPSVPYTGPNNSNSSQPTERAGKISIRTKAGVPSASPTPPATDSGYVALYAVTVAYGATAITSGNIAIATNAPFLAGTLGSLANYVTLAALPAAIGQFQYTDKTTAGTSTVTAPSWANHAEIQVVGGGGGGGSSGTGYAGGGGGAGGYAFGIVSITPGANYSVTVGAGGTGSSTGATGGTGGTSSFDVLASATGGSGGASSTATTAGGAGGISTATGIRTFAGGTGGDGNSSTSATPGGNGAAGPFGGQGRSGATAGVAGTAPGAGGGGAWNGSGSGGAGAAGAVLIKWLP